MPLRSTLIMIAAAAGLAALALVGLVLGTAPGELGAGGLALLYALIFLFVAGLATCIGAVIRRWRHPNDVPLRQLLRSLRQGTLFGLLIVAALALSHWAWLNAWSMLLLVAAAAFFELLFLFSRSRVT